MKGAIFDMDGLMFDTEQIWQKNWRAIASERGITLDPQFAKEICGTSGKLMDGVVAKYYYVEDGHEIAMDCTERVHADLKIDVPEKPGVHEILEWLKANGYKIAVASSSPKETIERNLIKTNCMQHIDALCSGREVAHGKPAPDIFLMAADLIGIDIKECYVFEDAYNGVRAGHASGARTIMIPDTQAPDDEMKEKAYTICKDLIEARDFIKEDNA